MNRLYPLFAVAIVVAVALAAGVTLAVSGGPTAFAVGGTQVMTRHDLDDELQEIASNGDFADALRSGASQTAVVNTHTQLDGVASDVWLTVRIRGVIADRELHRRGVAVSATVRSGVAQQLASVPGFAQLAPTLRRQVVASLASITQLGATIGQGSSAKLTAAAERACPSGRYLAHIVVSSLDTASSLAAQLAAGADFATLAKASSTDTTSAPAGGEVGCVERQSLAAEIKTAVGALTIGEVSAPVQSGSTYELLVVRGTPMQPDLANAPVLIVNAIMVKAAVRLDPRYGTWRSVQSRVCAPTGC